MRDPYLDQVAAFLRNILSRAFRIPVQVQFWKDGTCHFIMREEDLEHAEDAAEAWKNKLPPYKAA